ncbi:MAG TPA: hypothetical protein VLB80_02575 [Candidatus Babeliales bacterium]|nr:hypothetical protein [Candidatus Babeliales bacterium]
MNNFLTKASMLLFIASINNVTFMMDTTIITFPFEELPVERQESIANYMDGNSIMSFSKTSHDNHDLVKNLIKHNITVAYLNSDKDYLSKNQDFLLNNFVPIILVNHSRLYSNSTKTQKIYVDALNPYKSSFYFKQPGFQVDQKIEKLGEEKLSEALEQKIIQYSKKNVSYNNDMTYCNDKQVKSNQDIDQIYKLINPTKDSVKKHNEIMEFINKFFLIMELEYANLAAKKIKEISVFKGYIQEQQGDEYYNNI